MMHFVCLFFIIFVSYLVNEKNIYIYLKKKVHEKCHVYLFEEIKVHGKSDVVKRYILQVSTCASIFSLLYKTCYSYKS
jgi:hypothetical protein